MHNILFALKRNWLIFGSTFILCLLATFMVVQIEPLGSVRTSVFMTMGVQDFGNEADATDASTWFSETVRGWLQNPVVLHDVREKGGVEQFSVSGRPQERQNIVIEITSSSEENNAKVAPALVTVLNERIVKYNQNTGAKFRLIEQGQETVHLASRSKYIYLVAGILAGLLLGLFLVFAKEAVWRKITFPSQAVEVLNKKALFVGGSQSDRLFKNIVQFSGQFTRPFVLCGVSDASGSFMPALLDYLKRNEVGSFIVDASEDQELMRHAKSLGSNVEIVVYDPAMKMTTEREFVCIYTKVPQNIQGLLVADLDRLLCVELGKSTLPDLELASELLSDGIYSYVIMHS